MSQSNVAVQGLLDERPTIIIRYIRRGTLLLLFILGVAAAQYIWRSGTFDMAALHITLDRHPVLAPVVFIVWYAVSVSVILPTLPLNLAAGAIWGTVLGGVYATIGSVLGALSAFLVARASVGAVLNARNRSGMLRWFYENIERNGWKFVAFVRLNPVFPGPVNFLFGITTIPFRTYVWSSALFLLPPTFLFAYFGSEAASASQPHDMSQIVHIVAWVSAIITGLTGLALVTKRYLARSSEQRNQG